MMTLTPRALSVRHTPMPMGPGTVNRHGLPGLDPASIRGMPGDGERLDECALLGLIPGGRRCAIERRTTVYSARPPPIGCSRAAPHRAMVVLPGRAPAAVAAGLERLHGDQISAPKILDPFAAAHHFSPHNSWPRITGFLTPVSGCGVVRVVIGPS